MTDITAPPIVIFGKLSGLGLLFIGLAALIAAASPFFRVAPALPSAPAPASKSGILEHDFQLVQLGEFRRDQFLVDKRTGRVWQSICTGEAAGPDCKGMLIWDEMYVTGETPSSTSVSGRYLQNMIDQLPAPESTK